MARSNDEHYRAIADCLQRNDETGLWSLYTRIIETDHFCDMRAFTDIRHGIIRPLVSAARHGQLHFVQRYIEHSRNRHGPLLPLDYHEAIVQAVKHLHRSVARFLIESYLFREHVDNEMYHQLIHALRGRDFDSVESLLIGNEEPLTTLLNENGINLMNLFVLYRCPPSCLQTLVDRGIDINAYGNNGFTPLMVAVLVRSRAESFHFLCRKVRYFNRPNIHDTWCLNEGLPLHRTALMYVVCTRGAFNFINRYKRESRREEIINYKGPGGITALMLAAWFGDLKCVSSLIGTGAEVELSDDCGVSIIDRAIKSGNVDCLDIVMKSVSSEYISGCFQEGLFHDNVHDFKVFQIVMKYFNDMDIDYSDASGHTMLMLALKYECAESTELLLDRGATMCSIRQADITHFMICYFCQVGCAPMINSCIEKRMNMNIVKFGCKQSPLMCAIMERHNEIVKLLLDYGVDTNAFDCQGKTALMHACMVRNFTGMELLVAHGVNIDALDDMKKNALMYSCEQGHFESAFCLIEKGAIMDVHDSLGKTALIYSCEPGEVSLIKLLISRGADIHLCDNEGKTALTYAVHFGNRDCVSLLINKRSDLTIVDNNGLSLIDYAIKSEQVECLDVLLRSMTQEHIDRCFQNGLGHNSLRNGKVLSVLVKYVPDIDCMNEMGETLLAKAIKDRYPKSTDILLQRGANLDLVKCNKQLFLSYAFEKYDYYEIGNILLKYVSIDAFDVNGKTALMYACENRYDNSLVVLIGSNINAKDNTGMTALMIACKNDFDEGVNMISIRPGVMIDAWDVHGKTALIYACENRFFFNASKLIEQGADIEAYDNHKKNALMYASEAGEQNIVLRLLQKGANIDAFDKDGKTPLMYSCQQKHDHLVKILIQERANINVCDIEGKTALIYSCMTWCNSIVEFLIANGANANEHENDRKTALMHSCERGHVRVINTLIEASADINASDKYGKTALMYASMNGRQEAVIMLLEKHTARINTQDCTGTTALMYACVQNKTEIVRLLMKNKADIDASDNDGKTALMYARAQHNTEIATLLEKHQAKI